MFGQRRLSLPLVISPPPPLPLSAPATEPLNLCLADAKRIMASTSFFNRPLIDGNNNNKSNSSNISNNGLVQQLLSSVQPTFLHQLLFPSFRQHQQQQQNILSQQQQDWQYFFLNTYPLTPQQSTPLLPVTATSIATKHSALEVSAVQPQFSNGSANCNQNSAVQLNTSSASPSASSSFSSPSSTAAKKLRCTSSICTSVSAIEATHSPNSRGSLKSRAKEQQMRLFTCPVEGCGKVMNSRQKFVYHRRMHLSIRPFVCTWQQCGHSCAQKSNLTKHIRRRHFRIPDTLKEQQAKAIVDHRDANRYIQVNRGLLEAGYGGYGDDMWQKTESH